MVSYSSHMSLSGGSVGGAFLSGGESSRLSLSRGGARMSIRGAGSMHGGAGGAGVRISGSSRILSMGGRVGGGGGGFGFGAAGGARGGFSLAAMDGGIIGNEKFTMQNLNDRLANYISKVQTLEKANAELELKIRQYLESKATPLTHDYRGFLSVITDLQSKLQGFLQLKGSLYLGSGNANMVVDDYKRKYEKELSIRQCIEADVAGLKFVRDDLIFASKDLTIRLSGLQEELLSLQKTHKGDFLALQTQVGHKVNVGVEAAPQEDLAAILAGVREHYEAVAAKNRKELEVWFQAKTESLKKEVTTSTSSLQVSSSEVTSIKSTVQALQIELMSMASMKASLESTLAETQARYSGMLSGYQAHVCSLEVQLTQLRADLQNKSAEYNSLLDIKTKLEMEIAEYNQILNGQVSSMSSSSSRTKYTVVEEVVGKVVSSSTSSSASALVYR